MEKVGQEKGDSRLGWTEKTALELMIYEIKQGFPNEKTLEVMEPWVTANGLHPEAMAYASEASRSKLAVDGLKLDARGRATLGLFAAEVLEVCDEGTRWILSPWIDEHDLHPEKVISVDFSDLAELLKALEREGPDALRKHSSRK